MWNKLTIFSINNSPWILAWFKQFCNSSDLATAGFYKRSGASVSTLLRLFVALPLTGLNIYEFKNAQLPVPGRDAFYRLLQHPGYNWRALLYRISARIISYFSTLTEPGHNRVLIIDDTSYKRDRSTSVEYLGRQKDHSQNRYYRGFRLLTLAWSDGHSCLPCEFELLTNADPDKRYGPDPGLDRRTLMGRRVKAATSKATDVAVAMVGRVLSHIKAQYLVFDSWFAFPRLIKSMARKIPVICRIKDIPAVRFRHNRRIYSLKRLYQSAKLNRSQGPGNSMLCWINADLLSAGKVRVVFLQNPACPDKPMALISTNTSLTAEEICQIYARRWDIEVCFKALKQELGLHQLQVRRYSALVACTSLVFIRSMMISYYHRIQIDERTLPGMFHQCVMALQVAAVQTCIELLQISLVTHILADPHRPVMALVDDIAAIIQQFIAMISVNFSFKPNPILNCDS